MPKICILAGPTAVGKTEISLALARSLCGEIISADSAQVYKYMDIGTAKLKEEEMQGIKHYMIDEVTPDMDFSVAQFREKAELYIKDINDRSKLPIITGGTGLYINSLLNNLDFTDSISDEEYRREMQETAQVKGTDYVHAMLEAVDPASYKKLHPNDLRRVIRALEVYKHTGRPISYFQEKSRKQPPRYDFAYITLTMDRRKLYERIDQRVDRMMASGLVEEVEGLIKRGYGRELNSMQALGYKEIADFLHGLITKDEAVRIMKRDTRHYAKRQLTWFRGDKRVNWVDVDNFFRKEVIVENIIRFIAGKIPLI
ncbi:MAG TPA: tRNA (adenosine(37)-N6)-dimethylallyltransferase MiaA [Bacillota bacterium]|nr:tRNA (adenosine(37)-N6)-dimethylallyltransferase MiaA [Clostridiaceae bacterium]HNT02487.1 tRNA (adenosine(37)-N6)-dimethylallyltransferase MiaA [Bacillota bacterium]HPA55562.1 tRNA (adenosine(37)-N6)-dimethylallyltransferase MiaA [Bacillota bacterium]HPX68426.1 tRNA (adenosine(37)-N6)-dimethylallyltransferase MiaA [Bacillota bacterium]HQA65564.1 tRNA (adenosine(37)-N6)-dimethylallyltransferase MiaA [Bacillota bacterium]